MVFGQLTSRDSLRDLIVVINAHSKKTYHLGLGKTITRSNLAKANEKRDHKIFEEFAYYLIEIARKKKAYDDFNIEGKVYAFDSSTIDLWAPLKTLLWLLTCSSFQLLRCRNTHLAQLNSVFSALYLKKITALSFQTELLEMPLCLSVFWWAKFRKVKGGIKLHTLYDVTTKIPSFVHITSAKIHDVNAMDFIPYESEAYYVFD